jgi:hypothetical protein
MTNPEYWDRPGPGRRQRRWRQPRSLAVNPPREIGSLYGNMGQLRPLCGASTDRHPSAGRQNVPGSIGRGFLRLGSLTHIQWSAGCPSRVPVDRALRVAAPDRRSHLAKLESASQYLRFGSPVRGPQSDREAVVDSEARHFRLGKTADLSESRLQIGRAGCFPVALRIPPCHYIETLVGLSGGVCE